MAVFIVQPLAINISLNSIKLLVSINSPELMYIIKAIGSTISFAGKPNINPIKITPSSPISFPNGSAKLTKQFIIDTPFTFKFVNNQIKIPVGNAIIIARHKT